MKYSIIMFIVCLLGACQLFNNAAGFGDKIPGFKECYNGDLFIKDNLFKTNGFYLGKFSDMKDDSGGWNVMFYLDGTCVINPKSIGRSDVVRGDELHDIKIQPSWGTYYIENNIIVSQILCYSTRVKSSVKEYKHKIVNDSTLWLLSSNKLDDDTIWINDSLSKNYILPLTFIELENKPDSSFKLKEKEWFWCNKQKYNEYMIKLKEGK